MVKKKYLYFFIIFLGIVSILLFSLLGYSDFIYNNKIKLNGGGNTAMEVSEPVCYVDRTNKYYTTIEKALEDSYQNGTSDTIYVIPGTNPTITRNCIIDSNDRLFIYMLDESNEIYVNSSTGSSTGNPISSLNCVNSLTIAKNITLTCYGTIETSGRLSSSTANVWGGNTYGNYTEILMAPNSIIDMKAGSSIYLYGYIRELERNNNGSQLILNGDLDGKSGANLYIPFIFKFRGGSYTLGMILSEALSKKRCFLFDMYKIVNDSVLTRINYGANVYVWSNFTMNDKIYFNELNLVGTTINNKNFLFELNESGSFLDIKYDLINSSGNLITPKQEGSISDASILNLLHLDFYGGMNFDNLSLTISGYTVSVSNYFFPINYFFDISFYKLTNQTSAYYNMQYYLKMLPGSKLYIGDGCVFNVNEFSCYEAYEAVDVGGKYPSSLPAAYIFINGSLIANKFGGICYTSSSNGHIDIKDSASIVTKEIKSANALSANYNDITNYAKGYVQGELSQLDAKIYNSDTHYSNSILNGDLTYSWLNDTTNFHIKINLDKTSLDVVNANDENIKYQDGDSISLGTTFKIKNLNYEGDKDQSINITINGVSYDYISDYVYVVTGDVIITASSSTSGCVDSLSLITLDSGKTIFAKDLQVGDKIITWDFNTGTLSIQPVIYAGYLNNIYGTRITLLFNDGTETKMINQHSYFNTTINDYSLVSEDTIDSLLGSEFYSLGGPKKLVDYKIEKGRFDAFGILTAYNLNFFTDSLLSAEGLIVQHTFFKVNNMKYDLQQMKFDIDTYGLYQYEEWDDLVTREQFELLSGKYYKVYVGKGYCTYDYLRKMVIYFSSDQSKI